MGRREREKRDDENKESKQTLSHGGVSGCTSSVCVCVHGLK